MCGIVQMLYEGDMFM